MANRKVPLALCRGDTIAFISPSARLNHIFPAPLNRAKSHLERLGYRVKVIFNQSESLIFRDSILQRREEIQSAFADPLIKAIICTVDDSHANELLPHLDYGLIRMNAAITELGITHIGKPIGPVPRSLEWAAKLPDLGTDSQRPREQFPSPGWTWLRPGKATGRVFGGCLPSILHLAGTKFWPDYRDRILLLENPMGEKMEDPFSLTSTRAKMADLVNLGVFEQINGVIMVKDQCYGTDFPILLNVDVGHTDPILTVPLNAMVGLDSEKDEFTILEAGSLTLRAHHTALFHRQLNRSCIEPQKFVKSAPGVGLVAVP
ncbi:MAG: hypothetical protein ASARMPREDX12_004496 [Alectoria sarmentosa]|nr:MAG: hypothetical protein ASARMPREDX12_004496 [Alectoria sarmentosa]